MKSKSLDLGTAILLIKQKLNNKILRKLELAKHEQNNPMISSKDRRNRMRL